MEQDKLLEELKQNNAKALEELYKVSYKQCASFLLKNRAEKSQIKVYYQRALVIFLKLIRQNNFKLDANIETYVYTILRSLWLNFLKGQLSEEEQESVELNELSDTKSVYIPGIEEVYLEEDTSDKVLAYTLEVLDEVKDTECIRLLKDLYFEKISLEDLAKKYECSITEIKRRRHKCSQMLRKEVLSNYKDYE